MSVCEQPNRYRPLNWRFIGAARIHCKVTAYHIAGLANYCTNHCILLYIMCLAGCRSTHSRLYTVFTNNCHDACFCKHAIVSLSQHIQPWIMIIQLYSKITIYSGYTCDVVKVHARDCLICGDNAHSCTCTWSRSTLNI